MLLNNYWNYKTWYDQHPLIAQSGSGSSVTIPGVKKFNNGELVSVYEPGLTVNSTVNTTHLLLSQNACLKANLGISISTGETITADSYSLANQCNSSFSNYNTNYSISSESGNKEIVTFIITGTNTSGSAVTINTYGIYKKHWVGNNTTNYEITFFVIEDLEEPLVVPNGQGFTLIIQWTEQ